MKLSTNSLSNVEGILNDPNITTIELNNDFNTDDLAPILTQHDKISAIIKENPHIKSITHKINDNQHFEYTQAGVKIHKVNTRDYYTLIKLLDEVIELTISSIIPFIDTFCKYLSETTKLTKLVLNCYLNDVHIDQIITALKNNNSITYLNFSNNLFYKEQVVEFAEYLKNSKLKVLKLRKVNNDLSIIVDNAHNLDTLDLSGNNLDYKTVESIKQLILSSPIKKLLLTHNNFKPEDIHNILSCISSNNTLKKLYLDYHIGCTLTCNPINYFEDNHSIIKCRSKHYYYPLTEFNYSFYNSLDKKLI